MTVLFKRMFRNKKPLADPRVLQSFRLKFPLATQVIWQQVDVFKWLVNFNIEKKKCTALFNREGIWLETVTLIPLNKIPKSLEFTLEEKNNREDLRQIFFIQRPEQSLYELNLDNGVFTLRLLFDLSGNIIGKMLL